MDLIALGFILVGVGILSVITLLQQQNKREKLRQKRESREKRELDRKSAPCPECAESILVDAKRCKFCQADVDSYMEPFRTRVSAEDEDLNLARLMSLVRYGRLMAIWGWVMVVILSVSAGSLILVGAGLSAALPGVLIPMMVWLALRSRKQEITALQELAQLNSDEE